MRQVKYMIVILSCILGLMLVQAQETEYPKASFRVLNFYMGELHSFSISYEYPDNDTEIEPLEPLVPSFGEYSQSFELPVERVVIRYAGGSLSGSFVVNMEEEGDYLVLFVTDDRGNPRIQQMDLEAFRNTHQDSDMARLLIMQAVGMSPQPTLLNLQNGDVRYFMDMSNYFTATPNATILYLAAGDYEATLSTTESTLVEANFSFEAASSYLLLVGVDGDGTSNIISLQFD